jgi:hypothetical protein
MAVAEIRVASWAELQEQLLASRIAAIPLEFRVSGPKRDSVWNWLALAQHHGRRPGCAPRSDA